MSKFFGGKNDPKNVKSTGPSKFPAPKSTPSKPKEGARVPTEPIRDFSRTKLSHVVSGVSNIVTTKKTLLTQPGTVAKAIVKGKVSEQQDKKFSPKDRVKLAGVTGANLVPGLGTVTNFANGVGKSVNAKKVATQHLNDEGMLVHKTPVKSMAPTETKATTKSQPSVKLVPKTVQKPNNQK